MNPYFRWSSGECLASSLFDGIRSKELEESPIHKIRLEVDADDAFDYETGKSNNFTREKYIKILLDEAEKIHAKRILYLDEIK